MTFPDRGAVKIDASIADTEVLRFRQFPAGNNYRGRVTLMMFMVLLVPLGLLALLLGMERLERWTVAERDDSH